MQHFSFHADACIVRSDNYKKLRVLPRLSVNMEQRAYIRISAILSKFSGVIKIWGTILDKRKMMLFKIYLQTLKQQFLFILIKIKLHSQKFLCKFYLFGFYIWLGCSVIILNTQYDYLQPLTFFFACVVQYFRFI